jgi:hypothetical protein
MKNVRLSSCFLLILTFGIFSCDESSDPVSDTTSSESLTFSAVGDRGTSVGTAPVNPSGTEQTSGVITAGEWNDLNNWEFLKQLLSRDTFKTQMQSWGYSPLKRYSYSIKDQNANVIADASIKVKSSSGSTLWEARSDNFGKAELFPQMFTQASAAASTVVTYKNQSFTFPGLLIFEEGINTITLPLSKNTIDAVDVMFVVDATGSMGDELEYLKAELLDVLDRAAQTPNISLRTGSVFYRDQGDDYVTRISAFTQTPNTTVDFVKKQSAAGGGDWPEAVHTALEDAITQAAWSTNAKARLLFLVLDAPPHETDAVKEKIREVTKLAAAKGIKIIPITASGIDKSTEFLMRFIATSTNGTYVFITNHSGIGNEHIQATVGDYEVEFLNDLMVRLIKKYSE